MENVRNRADTKLVNNYKDYMKWTSKSKLCSTKQYLTIIWQ